MDLSDKTVETLIALDEPEALLETFRRKAARQKGKRWEALSKVLDEAALQLDLILNAKPAVRPEATIGELTSGDDAGEFNLGPAGAPAKSA